ncbi:hypothetical protein M885DRAFT_578856 [Pelagophyceae sp. CCMP2097]|nr:hypothetical protein M885DRAFT_578856 [Pelagophyceae sp. CCMP2097]
MLISLWFVTYKLDLQALPVPVFVLNRFSMAGENDGKKPSYLLDELDAAYTPLVLNDVDAELYICYVCYRIVSMSKQALCEPLLCPACEAVITGVDLERDGGGGGGVKRMFEKTPAPSSVKSGELAADADADADADAENVHPNTASQEPPKKKPRRAAECSVCRQAGLTTLTTMKIGTTSYNRPRSVQNILDAAEKVCADFFVVVDLRDQP